MDRLEIFVNPLLLNNEDPILKIKMTPKERRHKWAVGEILGKISNTLIFKNGQLFKSELHALLQEELHWLLMGMDHVGGGPLRRMVVGKVESDVGMANEHVWQDGKPIFETSTAHRRKLLAWECPCIQVSTSGS